MCLPFLSAAEFLFLLAQLINPHIFIIKTSNNPRVCVKRVRPCGWSSEECFTGSSAGLNNVFFFKSTPRAQVAQDASGYGRRSRSLSSSHRAHLEKPELCPRREDEGMMSCVRPSLSSHPSNTAPSISPSPPLVAPPTFFMARCLNISTEKRQKKIHLIQY